MRLLHIKGKYGERYIPIEQIQSFLIVSVENTIRSDVQIAAGGLIDTIAFKTDKPREIVEDLLKVVNTIDNDIIEYTIKGEE